jgi:hypothetical protein
MLRAARNNRDPASTRSVSRCISVEVRVIVTVDVAKVAQVLAFVLILVLDRQSLIHLAVRVFSAL